LKIKGKIRPLGIYIETYIHKNPCTKIAAAALLIQSIVEAVHKSTNKKTDKELCMHNGTFPKVKGKSH
jgi:hypothetical protein